VAGTPSFNGDVGPEASSQLPDNGHRVLDTVVDVSPATPSFERQGRAPTSLASGPSTFSWDVEVKKPGVKMRHSLLRASYTPDALAALMSNPHSREQAVRTIVEELGGTLEGWWLAFGGDDVVVVVRMPDETSMAALSMIVSSIATVRRLATTPLLTSGESIEAMRKAASSKQAYAPPDSWLG
jgi:uncharacterized protein with GYD domain